MSIEARASPRPAGSPRRQKSLRNHYGAFYLSIPAKNLFSYTKTARGAPASIKVSVSVAETLFYHFPQKSIFLYKHSNAHN